MSSLNSPPRNALLLIAASAIVSSTTILEAQNTPPVITTSSVSRCVSTLADWTYLDQSDIVESSDDSTADGPFVRRLDSEISHVQGAESSGFASHKSSISAFQIKGEAKCRSDAKGPGNDFYIIGASNVAELETTFTIPVDTTATFSSRIETDSSDNGFFTGGASTALIEFKGTRADGTPFRFYTFRGVDGVSIGPDEFFEVVELKAGSELTLEWMVSAIATEGYPGDEFAEATLRFELNLGDRDGDGLLDIWETDGVDIDLDGIPEIDLPAMGANPDKKNLFVELDSQAGIPVDLDALLMVEEAFADAPGSMVDNPDGSDGIRLLIFVDDNDLVNESYEYDTWPAEFDQQKSEKYGSAPLRAHPDWEEKIKPTYKLIFRYCIWGKELTERGYKVSGRAEKPGNDFIIAVNTIMERYSGTYEHLRTEGLAGVFMHELGHNLSLRHGGQDEVFFKPNYLSVMNYYYVVPLKGETVEGTPRSIAWVLDYARTAPMTLNEKRLREDLGLDGPAGRRIIFNAAGDTFEPLIQIADADAAEIDWNLSGPPIETETVEVDINRALDSVDDSLDEALTAYTDWDRLWYHLSGSNGFGDARLSADLPDPFDVEILSALDSFEATDRSTPDPVTPPPPPQNLTASAVSSSQIRITWSPVPDATSYALLRSLQAEGPYSPIAQDLTETSYPDFNLTRDTVYFYAVSATTPSGVSEASTPVSAAPKQNYSEWASDVFPEDVQPADLAPLADPDNDGSLNIHEYYFATDPNLPDHAPFHIHQTSPDTIGVQYRQSNNVASIEATLQKSTDLKIWTKVKQTPVILSAQNTYSLLQGSFSLTSTPLFFRIHLSILP